MEQRERRGEEKEEDKEKRGRWDSLFFRKETVFHPWENYFHHV